MARLLRDHRQMLRKLNSCRAGLDCAKGTGVWRSRLRIEGIQLAWTTVHKQHDTLFRARGNLFYLGECSGLEMLHGDEPEEAAHSEFEEVAP